MATLIFGGQTETVNDWPAGLYYETITRVGSLVYLVSTSIVPTWARDMTGGADGTGYLQVWDGGVELTREPDYVDTAELLDVAPSPGSVRWCFDGATYIRLGSEPAFDIRVSSHGYADALGTAIDSSYMLTEAGVTATTSGRLVVTARYIDNPSTTYLDVLNDAAISTLQVFGFNRLGEFEVLDIAPPTGDPVYVFALDNVIDVQRSLPTGQPYPMWRLTYQSGDTWPITQFADSVTDTLRDRMSRTPNYQTWIHEVPAILDKHLLAADVTMRVSQREPQNQAGWQNLRARYFELIGVEREEITVDVDFDGIVLQLDCNDVVSIEMPRLGCDAGKLMRIVAVRYDLSRKRASFTLWG